MERTHPQVGVTCFVMKSCGACLYSKGNEQHIPPQTDTVVRFAPEHVVFFSYLCYLGDKGTLQGYYA